MGNTYSVFLHFGDFELEQKSWLSLLAKLYGVALDYFRLCGMIILYSYVQRYAAMRKV